MDTPPVIISQNIGTNRLRKKQILFLVIFIIAAALVSYLALWRHLLLNINPAKQSLPQNSPLPQTGLKTNLEQLVKTTFTSSKHQDIVTYFNLASNEQNLDARYKNYLKAAKRMVEVYNQTKEQKYQLVLIQLKDYLKAFPQYQESDIVIPK